MSNPFKIIQPNEEAPVSTKRDVMGSIKTVVLILRFVQLFMADTTAVVLKSFKINLNDNDNANQIES